MAGHDDEVSDRLDALLSTRSGCVSVGGSDRLKCPVPGDG
jgi:hypothetical protein